MESQGEEPLLNALIERNPQLVDAQTASLLRWTQGTEQAARGKAYAEATFDTLEKVANHLGSTPGWKSLMWISGGVPMQVDGRPFDKEFEKAARALSNSNVAVYPIDPAGLQGEGRSGLQHDTNSVLRQLADRTGGRAYIDQNDILGALKQVTDTAQASYTVAYYPANERFDGKYREIQVRVKKPGLTASHRKGYYALDTAELGRQDGDKTVRAAALDPLDAAVIGIDAGLRKADDGQDEVVARIDTAELLWPDKDRFDVKTSVGVFQYDAGGRQLEGVVDDIDFTCDAARAQLFSRNGLSYGRKIALQPSASRLRLVVRSKRTGAIGSITIPIPAR
ncbi:MAG: hypothetical protein H6Q10_3322 [Acidobacteria bacterium]|nr:hypothetical protein [Acidobacteriota bacterium]